MSLSIRLFGNRNRAQELVVEAKRRMALLKQFMGFQNLKQLEPQSIRMSDGSTIRIRSFFGIDIVEIVGVGVVPVIVSEEVVGGGDVLFLISSNSSYAVWEITDEGDGIILTPIKTTLANIEKFIGLGSTGTDVVQSNEAANQHKFILSSGAFIPSDGSQAYLDRSYGVRTGIHRNVPLRVWGFRNSYGPAGYVIGGKEVFDADTAYLGYENDYDVDGIEYLCSGRHNWQEYDGEIIKGVSLWRTDTDKAKYRYKDSTNVFVYGAEIDYDASLRFGSFCYATLSKDKYIGYKQTTKTGEFWSWNSGPVYGESCAWVYGADPPEKEQWGYIQSVPGPYRVTQDNSIEYMFGDVVLEKGMDWIVDYDYRPFESQGMMACCCSPAGPLCCNEIMEWSRSRQGSRSAEDSEVLPLCYDHLDNDDETFIIIYYLYTANGSNGWNNRIIFGSALANAYRTVELFPGGSYSGKIKEFRLAYRINGGSLQKEKEITIDTFGQSVFDTVFEKNPPHDSFCRCKWTVSYTVKTDRYGYQVFSPTCKIEGKYMLYSYIIKKYVGLTTNQDLDAYNVEDWEFTKRILGVINMETAEKKEYEVNTELPVIGSFNYKAEAAIGFHIDKEA